MSTYTDLIQKIYHGHNPYTNYPVNEWAGTWYNDPGAARQIFKTAIDRASPGIIVEVGSFVGESTIFMADYLRKSRRDAVIICVDTWYGGFDHWTKVPEKLRFHFGRPSLYYQFLANIIKSGFQDMILPLSLDSINGARLLKHLGIVPNFVYVDASHEQGDVLRDMDAYWDLLPTGGCMLSDDVNNIFPGVLHDWKVFVEAKELTPIAEEGEKQLLLKP